MNTHWNSLIPVWSAAMRRAPHWTALIVLAGVLGAPTMALAVPSYARQTQQPCVACHVGGFGPELTPSSDASSS